VLKDALQTVRHKTDTREIADDLKRANFEAQYIIEMIGLKDNHPEWW
jgi:hypothetical protein